MRRIAIMICLALTLTGCATLESAWTNNQDPAVTKAALCQDAQLGLAIWSVMAENSTPEAQAYWAAYRRGVDMAVKTYCAGV